MKILVVDDEALARERLLRLLSQSHPEASAWEAATGEEALKMVRKHNPDLLLLDVRMPGMSGIELAGRLDSEDEPPAVIYCTAYDEYALEALQHQAAAYLLKPVRGEELTKAIGSARRVNRAQLSALAELGTQGEEGGYEQRTHLASQTHRGVESMPVNEVRCLFAEQKYVTAYSPSAELLIPDSLKELEREFGDRFLRIHRNALVAVEHVVRLQRDEDGPWCVLLDGVSHMPTVSRRHLSEVKARLVSP
ncbi:MAG: LytTR family DNA-binding domain-containing protein [Pseudomonadota bacterium]